MTVLLATASGEQHGLINTMTNNVPFDDFKAYQPAHKAKLIKEKKEDERIVEAEYLNSRGKHERLEKHYCRYAGDPIQQWKFIPGYKYKVPFGLVKEVNDSSKHLKQRSGLVSIDGNDITENGAPLDKDRDGDWLHKFIAVGF
jgi:hypothetical protein